VVKNLKPDFSEATSEEGADFVVDFFVTNASETVCVLHVGRKVLERSTSDTIKKIEDY
jgi:hypothetical protein